MKLEILNQEKMFALIHTRTISLKVQLMKIWKPEINTSSDQTRDALFFGAFHTIRPILTHSYLMNKWSTVAQLEIFFNSD